MRNIKYIFLFIVATIMPQMVWAGQYAGVPDGDGTSSSPFLIGDAKELAWFRNRVNHENYNNRVYYAELLNDIDLSSECSESLVQSWTPIGATNTNNGFLGHFDGKNHVITGLYIYSNSYDQGLFGVNKGTIKNLGVEGKLHLSGGYRGGTICGNNNGGTITHCYSKAEVSGNDNVGGIAGTNSGKIENCYNHGNIKAMVNNSSMEAGGICGTNTGTVEYCYNIGEVTANFYAGGICGNNSDDIGVIQDCYSTGSLAGAFSGFDNTAVNSEVITMAQIVSGELAYKLNEGTTDGSQAWYQKLGDGGNAYPVLIASGNNDDTVYGFYLHGESIMSFSNNGDDVKHTIAFNADGMDETHGYHHASYTTTGWVWTDNEDLTSASASITFTCSVCGDVKTPEITVTNDADRPNTAASCGVEGHNYYVATGTLVNKPISDKHEQVLPAYPLHAHFDEYGFCDVCHRYYLAPELGADGYYQLTLPAHLHWFAEFVNTYDEQTNTYPNINANARMMNDIDAMCSEDFQWTPIAQCHSGCWSNQCICGYKGTFEGNGKTVTNLYIGSQSSEYDKGFIGHTNHEGVLKDLTIKSSTIEVEGPESSALREGSVGAFIGVHRGTVSGCSNYVPVKGTYQVGGIVGYVISDKSATIDGCNNFGDVFSSGSFIGGIVGHTGHDNGSPYHNIISCVNKGNVSSESGYGVGGIVGYCQDVPLSLQIINCENHGTIKSNASGDAKVGGIVGFNRFATFENVLNTGDVIAKGDMVGGICGYSSAANYTKYVNCYNTGNVSTTYSNANIGGIVGMVEALYSESRHNFTNVYNKGVISCPSSEYAGTFGGWARRGGIFKNCFALEQEGMNFLGARDNEFTFENTGNVDAEYFASGEMAWLFNNSSDAEPVWYQAIGVDAAPTFEQSPTAIVHYDGSKYYNDLKNIPSLDVLDATAYDAPLACTVDELTYTHSFDNSGAWYSYYVPFEMPVEELTAKGVKVAYINGIHQYDDDEDGTIDRTDLEVFYVKNGKLRANYPYLVKTNAAKEVTISLSNVTVQPSVSNTISLSTAVADYYITGTYTGITAQEAAANGWLAVGMDSEGKSALVAPSNNIRAQRWYLGIKEKDSPVLSGAAASAAKAFRIVVKDEATSIQSATEAEGYRLKTTGIYNLNGQRVNANHRGIVIKNGKKVMQ